MDGRPRILIVGGGYGGMHTALRLERLLRPGEATVMTADPRSYMTYQPLLAEAAAGDLEPRHVVVPLRAVLHRTQVIKASVSSIDHEHRVAYLAETGIGFKTIGEVIHLPPAEAADDEPAAARGLGLEAGAAVPGPGRERR